MNNSITTEQMTETQLISVLESSLYPGAKTDSIKMVLGYCKAAGLDPMQKPVHIVPINTKNAKTGAYEWRDTVMPGIGLYRIQADRSGTMAGISEPEFGPEITKSFVTKDGKNISLTFPEWCKVTAKKLVGTLVVDFSAKEYWLENYATDSSKSDAPNAMWRKRPRGQIAKCAEAQALRKGWPEIGAAPTAEEMEGKQLDAEYQQPQQFEQGKPAVLEQYADDDFARNLSAWSEAIKAGKASPDTLSAKIATKSRYFSEEQRQVLDAIASEKSELDESWDKFRDGDES